LNFTSQRKISNVIYSECLKNSAATCTKLSTVYFIKTNTVTYSLFEN